ncbi:2-succinylbenzoate--CoA ligase [Altericista sp. CCNU0014]|uniref:2-succinylbenzoate--CoA ligase n=1 Tax=Altericista sp. CCNU0014 TaxID=3082949 RepID=UPI00384DECC7
MSDRFSFDSARAAFAESSNFDLLGADRARWIQQTRFYSDRLSPFAAQTQFPRILLSQTDPIEFLAGFAAACIAECPVFLGNPNWSIQEWEQVLHLVQPHQVWGTLPIPVQPQALKSADDRERGWIMIPTGGTSGQIKFAIHTWTTLSASVRGFQSYFEVAAINSCCVLPLYHVSGLMQFLRSLLTHGRLRVIPFADLLSGQSENPEQHFFLSEASKTRATFFLSLVPTQLQRLLQQPHRLPWLQHPIILLGGAPAWPALLDRAKQHRLNLAPTYGMTETASQIATLKPQAFLQGRIDSGPVLPHARIEICDSAGQPLAARQTGTIVVRAKSLFRGYYPRPSSETSFRTDDLGYFDAQNHLHIAGRSSRKIISGGENVFPEEVEAALYETGTISDVCVMGLPDAQWGEVVAALYVPRHPGVTSQQLKAALESKLSRYKHPKHWLQVDEIPRNAQGKVDRTRLPSPLEIIESRGD